MDHGLVERVLALVQIPQLLQRTHGVGVGEAHQISSLNYFKIEKNKN